MLGKFTEEIKELVDWYERTKEIVIIAESLDVDNAVFPQPMHELRYCLDHFIRAIVFEEQNESIEVVKKAIYSAKGHLQRAYSDSIEWIFISVKDEYIRILKNYTTDEISTAFPKYYNEIRPNIEKISELINSYKVAKRSEKNDIMNQVNGVSNEFINQNLAQILQEYLQILHNHEPSLAEVKKRNRRAAKFDKVIFPVITGLVAAIISGIVVALIMG